MLGERTIDLCSQLYALTCMRVKLHERVPCVGTQTVNSAMIS